MARMNMVVDDFSAGEVSPLTEARISSSEFRNGLRESTNMVPDAHGPVMGRPGMEYIDEMLSGVSSSATLIAVNYSPDNYYIIALYDKTLEVWDGISGLKIHSEATPYESVYLHGRDEDQHLFNGTVTPAGKEVVLLSGQYHPAIIKIDPDTDAVTFEDITFTDPPAEWTTGNYPTTMTFFQGRSWWGGSKAAPDTFWSSRTYSVSIPSPDHYWHMTPGTAPDEAIVFQIARHGRIVWMEAGVSLLIGTENGEIIVASETGLLQPGDVQVQQQSAYGSAAVPPVMVGNEVLYVTGDRAKLRSMWYRWVESGWMSLDATFTAEHITYAGITQITYARNPYSALWLTLKSGEIVCCSYQRQEDRPPAIGWYRVVNSRFRIRSAVSGEAAGRSEIWTVGYDPYETGATKRMRLMKKKVRNYESDDEVFLDCFKTKTYSVQPTDKPDFGDVSFFNGQIDVVADGFHYPDVTVNFDGTVDLPQEHRVISIGHPYVQKIITMPVIMSSSEGKVGHQMKRWNKVFLRLIRSYRPLVNGDRAPERHVETNDDIAEPYVDGFVQYTTASGWDRDGKLTIQQDLPFRLLLTGIYGEFTVEQI